MSIDDKETLSQLMDGEWQDLNPSKSVEAACADEELKATWSRYHLIRDVIRNDAISVDTSLASRISQAVADEPSYTNVSAIGHSAGSSTVSSAVNESAAIDPSAPASRDTAGTSARTSKWGMGMSGVALAACVALATVLGLNFWQGAPDSAGPGLDTAQSSPASVQGAVIPEVEFVSNNGIYWETPEPSRSAAAEKRLNMLLSAHIENSPTAERTGLLPYSRLVGYDEVAPE